MDSSCKTIMDHVYCHPKDGNYKRSNNGSTEVLSILKENKQLKAMLLLHLDLIQEQSDQLIAKDKLLASLREENESLKARLEQIGKRMTKNKAEPLPLAVDVGQEKKDNISRLRAVNKVSTVKNIHPPATETSQTPAPIPSTQKVQSLESKYKICDDNTNVNIHGLGENYGKYITKIVLQRVQSPGVKVTRAEDQKQSKQTEEQPQVDWKSLPKSDEKKEKGHEKTKSVITSNGTEEKKNSNCEHRIELESCGVRTRRKLPTRPEILTTKKLYCAREWMTENVDEDLNKEESEALKSENPNLEIPKWTIKEFHGLYTIEGTEDLSDDVFMKRHSKLEVEEKRRKKWDAQRIREQRTIERLKRRHCKDELTDSDGSSGLTTFCNSPDSIKYIQISDEIPVNAFGEAIPKIKAEPFKLPWHDDSYSKALSGKSFSTANSLSCTEPKATTTGPSALAVDDGNALKCKSWGFGQNTALLIVKKRRRQSSQSASTSSRPQRKALNKN